MSLCPIPLNASENCKTRPGGCVNRPKFITRQRKRRATSVFSSTVASTTPRPNGWPTSTAPENSKPRRTRSISPNAGAKPQKQREKPMARARQRPLLQAPIKTRQNRALKRQNFLAAPSNRIPPAIAPVSAPKLPAGRKPPDATVNATTPESANSKKRRRAMKMGADSVFSRPRAL